MAGHPGTLAQYAGSFPIAVRNAERARWVYEQRILAAEEAVKELPEQLAGFRALVTRLIEEALAKDAVPPQDVYRAGLALGILVDRINALSATPTAPGRFGSTGPALSPKVVDMITKAASIPPLPLNAREEPEG